MVAWVLEDAELIGPEYAALMVLTACQVWRFAVEGVHCSNAAAARRALEREPALGVVEDALRQRTVDRPRRSAVRASAASSPMFDESCAAMLRRREAACRRPARRCVYRGDPRRRPRHG
jgi:hypothetical protein